MLYRHRERVGPPGLEAGGESGNEQIGLTPAAPRTAARTAAPTIKAGSYGPTAESSHTFHANDGSGKTAARTYEVSAGGSASAIIYILSSLNLVEDDNIMNFLDWATSPDGGAVYIR